MVIRNDFSNNFILGGGVLTAVLIGSSKPKFGKLIASP
jgi:hypothetical protein